MDRSVWLRAEIARLDSVAKLYRAKAARAGGVVRAYYAAAAARAEDLIVRYRRELSYVTMPSSTPLPAPSAAELPKTQAQVKAQAMETVAAAVPASTNTTADLVDSALAPPWWKSPWVIGGAIVGAVLLYRRGDK